MSSETEYRPAVSAAPDTPSRLVRTGRALARAGRAVASILGTVFVLGLSLLPLSALLIAMPAVSPNEAVLRETVRPARSWLTRTLRRLLALFAGLVVVLALLAFSVEVVSRLPLPDKGQFAPISRAALGFTPASAMGSTEAQQEEALKKFPERLRPYLKQPLWMALPPVMVQHWPFVILTMYLADLVLLLAVGQVPLAYNLRNLWVRRRISAITALAFTVVVALLVGLLGFVNGMNRVAENTGIPGNVFVLSDGATDEFFSNLSHGDLGDIAREKITLDEAGNPVKPFGVKEGLLDETDPENPRLVVPVPPGTPATITDPKVRRVPLASPELYMSVNQPIPTKPGALKRRRFLSVRALDDPLVAAEVHKVGLQPGGRWFSPNGVEVRETGETGPDGKPVRRAHVQVVLGAGAASTLGADVGKDRLEVGDTFTLVDEPWVVVGLMKTEGTTFSSEIWIRNIPLVGKRVGKENKITTLVLRTENETLEEARQMAFHLTAASKRYAKQKLKAYAETDYYAALASQNEGLLRAISMIAVIMAIGGVFGVMNTMFASIAARIREVGVLRILGFKRWQILISFMLESLILAAAGGLLGCVVGYFFNGIEMQQGGQGGKTIALEVLVDYQTVVAGMLFTLVMGRLGGLIPALSAMRMGILESLR
ncbi:MAG TPA: FtsX-like permease family protein [Gemmata sp.]|nr:FtsX-like permease family protein [Gemmata sp.]